MNKIYVKGTERLEFFVIYRPLLAGTVTDYIESPHFKADDAWTNTKCQMYLYTNLNCIGVPHSTIFRIVLVTLQLISEICM